jgi:two-component system cell cycle sensor histidine kinase/response regulator CckA
VRELTQATLEGTGYTVIDAASGVEAIATWERHRDGIQLLLTDVVMPGGIRGSDLAARLRPDRPDLRVVLTSGYSVERTSGDLALDEHQAFLPKPFSRRALLDVVRRVLDA